MALKAYGLDLGLNKRYIRQLKPIWMSDWVSDIRARSSSSYPTIILATDHSAKLAASNLKSGLMSTNGKKLPTRVVSDECTVEVVWWRTFAADLSSPASDLRSSSSGKECNGNLQCKARVKRRTWDELFIATKKQHGGAVLHFSRAIQTDKSWYFQQLWLQIDLQCSSNNKLHVPLLR